MSVSLNNFVNINLEYITSTSASGIRDTVVLLDVGNDIYSQDMSFPVTLSSNEDLKLASEASDTLFVQKYVKCFFANGGKKILLYNKARYNASASEQITNDEEWLLHIISTLPTENIVITSTATETIMRSVAEECLTSTDYEGINEKIFISSFSNQTSFTYPVFENYILKYGPTGIEMTVAAYLSKINVESTRSIEGYAFTKESVSSLEGENRHPVTDDNTTVETLISKNCNCDSTVIAEIINIGGNTVAGKDLVNHYLKIILTQTLTERLVKLLKTKIRYNQTGLNLISNTIVDELNKYRTFGYLSTDKIWNDEDLYVVGDTGKEYLLISKDEPLSLGYKFTILPFDSLTEPQKEQHLLPKIYLLIADSYDIRKITINGYVY